MSEYCEYMWDPTRGHGSTALARSIYEEEARFDKRDKKLAIKTVRAILREMPNVGKKNAVLRNYHMDLKHCTDEYITRFLLARKYRTEQAAALIAAYQAQVAHRQDIFGNLTARDPALQRALRAGIPGVLPARDRKGRCVLVILASQWDPIAVPALSVQRAIFLVLEILIQDPRNQQSGFVAVVDWSGFSLRQGGALGAAALRNLIAALRGRFPARFKAIHFLSAPLYVQATLALVKPFLDEKTRSKIYLHGNNLSTLHDHLPTDILPAELGGTGPAFNPGLWAEPVIHSAMKEAELAAIKKEKEFVENIERTSSIQDRNLVVTKNVENCMRNETAFKGSNSTTNKDSSQIFPNSNSSFENSSVKNNVSRKLINNAANSHNNEFSKNSTENKTKNGVEKSQYRNNVKIIDNGNRSEDAEFNNEPNRFGQTNENPLEFQSEANSNEFEMTRTRLYSDEGKDNSLDNRSENSLIRTGKNDSPSEEMTLIT